MTQRNNITTFVCAVAVGLGLGACGSQPQSQAPAAPSLSGLASTGAAAAAVTVTVKDSSIPARVATATADADGTFAVDLGDLTAPYLLKAQWMGATGTERLYSMATQPGTANLNPLTDAAVEASSPAGNSDDTYSAYSGKDSRSTASSFTKVIEQLRTVLAPLFDLYGIGDPGTDDASSKTSGLRQLLKDVKITVNSGTVTVTNRATGGVIFTGSLSNLASGTFYPENMPVGPGTLDGAALYTANCATCHGPLATSTVQGASTATISAAIASNLGGMGKFSNLTSAQIEAIATALGSTTTPPPATCTSFTYSAWGACQPSSTQTRTVLTSSPAGCTGGSPVTTQACTYVPPVTTCTSFTYSTWGACQPDNTQTRTVLTSSPAGCTGGSPVTTQACTYVPPVTTCTSFTYSTWGACQPDNTQTRTVLTSSPASCTGGSPATTQACTYVPPACTYTYSAWSACSAGGTQTRTVLTTSPAGCIGTPVLSQACTPPVTNPATEAMVVSSCTGCHGLTSNTTVFRSGGYTVVGRSASQWLTSVNQMVALGASLAPGTTAQNYADYLATVP